MRILRIFLLLVCSDQVLTAGTVVVPAANQTVAGNSEETLGFLDPTPDLQFVYTAKNFSGPVVITGLAFRPEEGARSSIDMVIPNLSIRLTTYRNGPANLSGDYQLNKAADDTLVFSGSTHWVASGLFSTAPNPFVMPVTFSQPFTFDPRQGDLLMKLDSSGGSDFFKSSAADAAILNDFSTGYIYAGGGGLGGSAFILVTQFNVANVPEPSVIALLFVFGSFVVSKRLLK